MTMLYPIVLETEESGAVSAYVPGLPVYAAADTHAKAERAIRTLLTEYLHAHPATRPDARVRVARFTNRGKKTVDIVGVAALLGGKRTAAKRAHRGRTVGSVVVLRRTRPHGRKPRAEAAIPSGCTL
jgi:hypothetical protein